MYNVILTTIHTNKVVLYVHHIIDHHWAKPCPAVGFGLNRNPPLAFVTVASRHRPGLDKNTFKAKTSFIRARPCACQPSHWPGACRSCLFSEQAPGFTPHPTRRMRTWTTTKRTRTRARARARTRTRTRTRTRRAHKYLVITMVPVRVLEYDTRYLSTVVETSFPVRY